MITVREVKTKKEQKEFLEFPLRLYKNNPFFVPPLYGDEKKIFRKDYIYYETCEAVYFLAYKGETVVGRISGILQKTSNEKTGERRVRFTRFDSIDDYEVAKALFDAVESWARSIGMDTVCGPLGFSDLEREGLLIEGFDELSTFEEQYNAAYYGEFLEKAGYVKEVDWTESRIYPPEDKGAKLEEMANFVMNRYGLHLADIKSTSEFIKKYADDCFALLDRAYEPLYGTVPMTDSMKKMLLDNFKLIIKPKYVAVILDKEDKVVSFGVCFPSIAKAVQKSNGHLTPAAIVRLLWALNHPSIIDLALVGVDPVYANRGISVIISAGLSRMLQTKGVEYAETNLNLEENYSIQNQWKRFVEVKHKRRRSYIKKLNESEEK